MRIPLKCPPGLVGDDTSYDSAGRWRDGSNVRFWRGLPQTIGGWESLTADLLTGVCRKVFAWTDTSAVLNVGFGTNSNLQLWQGGALYDLTPTLARPSQTLGANPLSVTSGDATVTVTMAGHGFADGDLITISGATAVGGITPNRTSTAVTVVDDDSFTYEFTSNASGTATGGGSAVVITPLEAYTAGAVDGTGGAGYGTGTYSTGTYSSPSTEEFYPRTWSLSAFGQQLIANPRGGALYAWTNDTGVDAAPLAESPRQVTYSLVSHTDQIFALGCNEEVSGVFNPLCIRHSGIRRSTEWNTAASTTAREYVLKGGGRIVGGVVVGQFILVWTSDKLFVGTYVGALNQPWRFDPVGEKCGLIGPNAFAVSGSRAVWLAPDLQFRAYGLGGSVEIIPCPIRDDMADNLVASQSDKITASTISVYNEVRFDYPDQRDGTENSRYVTVCLTDGSWSKGIMARSAFVDAGPQENPIGVDPTGAVFWHERGNSADGGAFEWFIESADQYLSPDQVMMVRGVWPDVQGQIGGVAVTTTMRFWPQGDETSSTTGPLAPSEDKADFRISGRLAKLKFSGNSAPTFARIGQPTFDVTPTGAR